MRNLTGMLGLFVAFAGVAVADGNLFVDEAANVGDVVANTEAYADRTTAHGSSSLAGDAAEAAAEYGLYDEGNYGDLDATAATEYVSGTVDADGSVAEVEEVSNGSVWTWLSLRSSALVSGLATALGVGDVVPDAGTDANFELYASQDGVDLDASVQPPCVEPAPCDEVTFDGSPAGHADGLTWEWIATLRSFFP